MTDNTLPFMYDFYTRFYHTVATSAANAEYCERVYGRNLCQHGFADLPHLDDLIRMAEITASSRVLDLGCGNGMIAEYISDQTGAHVTGIDFIPQAIENARARTQPKRDRLDFRVMDMSRLDFLPTIESQTKTQSSHSGIEVVRQPPSGLAGLSGPRTQPAEASIPGRSLTTSDFDVIVSVDTLYFTDLVETLAGCRPLLREGGRLVAFFDQSCGPDTPLEQYPSECILPDNTDLARALRALGWSYRTWDYSEAMLAHVLRRRPVLEELKAGFEAEGNLFLYESHLGESRGIERAYTHDAGRRYLYLASPA